MKTTKAQSPTIVFDLDGVIANIDKSMFEVISSRGIPADQMDYGKWLISSTEDKDALEIFNSPLFWANMKPYEDAWYQINYWFSIGYNIDIVTARKQKASVEQTLPWLEKWNINSRMPQFSEFGKKINIIKNIDPIFVVEDNPAEIKELQKAGIKCYLRKQWYNEEYWSEYESIDTLFDIILEPLPSEF
ncbi:MAG: 5 nucleotidase, deoxy (Pyrimidine), cytosolic type protein [Pseudomonadota bacterium]|jgi:FMN phosphatase YigB (HAD superfamily)